jgi:cytochrome c-type biogenesis protein CcmF
LRVFEGTHDLGPFAAQRNLYLTGDSTTGVALRSTPRDDLYVILAGWTQDGRATLRLLVNPLVMWMWVGGLVLSVGAIVAMLPEARPRTARVPASGPALGTAAAPLAGDQAGR